MKVYNYLASIYVCANIDAKYGLVSKIAQAIAKNNTSLLKTQCAVAKVIDKVDSL